MSLKAIELQVALPRTHDAGKVQEQLLQRSQIAHDHAAREMQKEAERNERAVIKNERKDKLGLKKDQSSNQERHGAQITAKKKEETEEEDHIRHPYKGNSIDFTG